MKQLLILSGKGGTGKTTIASAFIKLAEAKAYADCDVDAPNLHLAVKHASEEKKTDFYGMNKAEINTSLCSSCDLCRVHCRFDAIDTCPKYSVDSFACEGCGVCEAVCPMSAISLKPAVAGVLKLYANNIIFSTAKLNMGSGNSGMLVTKVKKQMMDAVSETDLAIIDGSPGIGCPVIASISGVDMVLIVTEPTISGISDLVRIIETAEKIHIKISVCINKYDINIKNSEQIAVLCNKLNLPLTTVVPYDIKAVKAVNDGMTIVDIDCASGQAVKQVFDETIKILFS